MQQTIYRDSRASTPSPMLTKSNYHERSLLMKVKLQARQLWGQSTSAALGTTKIIRP
jgi:hypothetical protein